jgi:hypothetical protein
VAYEHFFEGFDRGEQKFEYEFRIGGVTPEMGLLMAAGNVTGKPRGQIEGAWADSISPSFSTRGVEDPRGRSRTTSWSKGLPHKRL